MNGSEILESFYVHYDRVTSFGAPGYTEGEALLFLNNAQDQFIKDKVFGRDFRPPAFEDNQKRVVDILPLVARSAITGDMFAASPLYGPQGYSILKTTLASNRILYTVELEVRVTRTNPILTNQYVRCERIKTEQVGKFAHSPTNRTHHLYPKFVETVIHYHVIGDYYTTLIDYGRITYIRKPYPITAGISEYTGTYSASYMNLIPSVHQEIVNLAVQNALQTIQDPRWQSKVNQEQLDTT